MTGASSGIGEAVARLLAVGGTKLVLVARRRDRLAALASELGSAATFVAIDVTTPEAPSVVATHLLEHHDGNLDLLVNNAGASWRGTFAEVGHENIRRTMELNFDAVVRMTEALLPLLRDSAPSSIVNVSSTAGRISRAGAGAYSASKYALAGWTDSLHLEEKPNGVHVGLVLPGFIETEGFPATELRAKLVTRWVVSSPDKAAEAIIDAGPGGRAERYVPRPYALAAVARIVLPRLVRRVLSGGAAKVMTTATGADAAERES